MNGLSWPGCAKNNTGGHSGVYGWICNATSPSSLWVFFFFSPVLMKGFLTKTPPCMQARVKDSAAPTALSLWSLRNKQSFKYFPATGPPVSLQAVFFPVKCICLRCLCDRIALSESKDVKKPPGRGKVAGHSKHVDTTWEEGTQLYSVCTERNYFLVWKWSQKESKCKELIMEVSVITLGTCVVVTCWGWTEIPSPTEKKGKYLKMNCV